MPAHSESAESKYLREHYNDVAAKYPGQWVAVEGEQVVAHNTSPEKLAQEIKPGSSPLVAFMLPPGTRLG